MTAIGLVVSDVDGTLVTPEKTLTPAAVAAAGALRDAGIGLSLVSARPPRGMATLVAALSITLPCAGFNGGVVFAPGGAVIEGRWLAPSTAMAILDLLAGAGVCAWVFAGDDWFLTDPDGPEVWRERRTIDFEPTVAADLRSLAGPIGKIVGVSDDAARLDACEALARGSLAGAASIERSQSYYLDFAHPDASKGLAVTAIARGAGVPLAATAVVGDMFNDLSMFAVAGLPIAMGQAPDAVKAAAKAVTAANTEDGFAAAVSRFILPSARAA
jgi:Cof subfamily protein (haloacid dehalogenase superfamily)